MGLKHGMVQSQFAQLNPKSMEYSRCRWHLQFWQSTNWIIIVLAQQLLPGARKTFNKLLSVLKLVKHCQLLNAWDFSLRRQDWVAHLTHPTVCYKNERSKEKEFLDSVSGLRAILLFCSQLQAIAWVLIRARARHAPTPNRTRMGVGTQGSMGDQTTGPDPAAAEREKRQALGMSKQRAERRPRMAEQAALRRGEQSKRRSEFGVNLQS